MVQEVQQQLISPVQVLNHQHGRALLGQRLQEPPPGRERLHPPVAAKLHAAGQPHQGRQVLSHPGRLRLLADEAGDRPLQLGGGLLGRIGVQDAGLGLDDLPQRPQRHPLPVGQAAALTPGDQLPVGLDQLREFPDEPAFADPRHPDQGHQLRRLLGAGSGQRVGEQAAFPLPSDQGPDRRLVDVHPETGPRPKHQPHRHRVGLALGIDRLRRLISDLPVGGPEGRRIHQDAVDRGGGL